MPAHMDGALGRHEMPVVQIPHVRSKMMQVNLLAVAVSAIAADNYTLSKEALEGSSKHLKEKLGLKQGVTVRERVESKTGG